MSLNNRLNILYTCDNAYLALTSISMASVIENNKDRDITFFIATEEDNSPNLNKIRDFYKENKRISIKYLDLKKYDNLLKKQGLDRWGSNSYYVYWKMFAYDLMDEDYVWYVDSDVLCLREIINPGIDNAIGAVIDSAHASFNKYAHIDENYYLFNTGTLFVDIKKWKENRCVEKVIDYIKNMKYKPLLCDEDILSISIQKDFSVLNPKYNYFSGYDYYGIENSFKMYSLDKKPFYRKKEIENAKNDVTFYHCLGGVFGRPWEKDNFSPKKEEFAYYRSLSPFKNYETKRNTSTLFKIEKKLECLPKPIYNFIHNKAIEFYYKKSTK